MHRIPLTLLPGLLLLGCAASGTQSSSSAWQGELQVHGALRAMFHQGQTGTMTTLDTLLPNPRLYAVGALSNLSGEITIIAGDVFLSYPQASGGARHESPTQTSAGATLLVSAEVEAWHSVTTKHPILFADIDDAIGELAVSAGMNLAERFPFLLEGEFEDLRYHVIDGTRLVAGGTSHEDHLASSVQCSREQGPAQLIGFYSNQDQGVFTHMGSTTHIHCVVDVPLETGHVDHVTIPAGTVVKFPVDPNP